MKIETRVHLTNGQTVVIPDVPNEFDGNFFKNIEQFRRDDINISIYGRDNSIPVRARDIRSIEFVISD